MKLQSSVKILVRATFILLAASLQHEKSFLASDGASAIQCLDVHNNTLLISNSNDVVQKDIETGQIQRTFRAHTNRIQSFVVTEDSRMITSAYDDMIIVWSLSTGSVLKRLWVRESGILISSVSFFSENLVIGDGNGGVRKMDLATGRVVILRGKFRARLRIIILKRWT